MAFRGLQVESATQGQGHYNIAKELTTLVADPFEEWAAGYRVCRPSSVFFSPSDEDVCCRTG
jgi:hypothetical protein